MITGIVVVSYHNAEDTSKYVTKQLVQLSDDYRVVVVAVDANDKYGQKLAVDCGLAFINSPKQVVQHAKGWCIVAKENLGYAKGNNLGVEILKKSGIHFDYYLFSNDDIEIMTPDALSILGNAMREDENIAGIGPRIIGLDGNDQSPHTRYISPQRQIGWKLLSFLRKKRRSSAIYTNKSSLSVAEASKAQQGKFTATQAITQASKNPPARGVCYWVSGAFMMVKANRFEAVNGFDPRTFLYFEEVILAERFKRYGWHFAFEPSATVVHYEGGSTTVKSSRRDAIEMESRMLYYKEYKRVNIALLWLYKLINKI